MKKQIALCLIACLVLMFLLCACQAQDTAQPQSESTVAEETQDESSTYNFLRIFASLFLLLFGVINFTNPKKMWEISKGRNRKPGAKEPTPAELNGERVSGLILIVLGIFLYFGMIR